ncbi:MAG: DsbA family protein [Alphaproteobacteria bacterium]|nr:MAG: DsbA family protein [Alphaproteobacteria bacterium]
MAEEFSRDEIKALVLEAIRENPDIVMEAVEILRKRDADAQAAQAEEALRAHGKALFADPNAPVIGNPDGDVTVVEFFDYNCPYCKRVYKDVDTLIELDDGVRVVFREWPILGPGSEFAARAALAAREQGKYAEFHDAMMSFEGRAAEPTVLKVARDVGLDIDRLKADMQAPEVDAHIAQSMALAQALGFNGTPSFVIGERLVPGVISIDQMQSLVAEAREKSAGE